MSDNRRVSGGAAAPGFFMATLPSVTLQMPAGVGFDAQRPIAAAPEWLSQVSASGAAGLRRTTNETLRRRFAKQVPGALPYQRDPTVPAVQAVAQANKRHGKAGVPRHQRERMPPSGESPIGHHYLLWSVVVTLVLMSWR